MNHEVLANMLRIIALTLLLVASLATVDELRRIADAVERSTKAAESCACERVQPIYSELQR